MSGNSHQRRRADRHWTHRYHLDRVDPYGLRAIIIREWCEEQFGKSNYGHTWSMQTYSPENWTASTFVLFHREKDANWFLMKWAA